MPASVPSLPHRSDATCGSMSALESQHYPKLAITFVGQKHRQVLEAMAAEFESLVGEIEAEQARGPPSNPALTPGSINPAVTQDDIRSTICIRGWTRTVRPSREYTYQLKREQIRQYGYADRRLAVRRQNHRPLGRILGWILPAVENRDVRSRSVIRNRHAPVCSQKTTTLKPSTSR